MYLLRPYSRNVTSRIVKTPKLYFTDTGLCSYLTGWTSPETLANGAMGGAMLETHVIGELLKRCWNRGMVGLSKRGLRAKMTLTQTITHHLGKKCFDFSSLDKANIPDILAKV